MPVRDSRLDVLAGARHEHVLDGEALLVGEQDLRSPDRWSRPRKRSGTTNTRAFERRSAWDTSRARKIGMSGQHTAPMRSVAIVSTTNSPQFGSW